MRDRQSLVFFRRVRGGFVACIPFAAALASEPNTTSDPEDPPIGGAPISAAPINAGAGVIRYEGSFFTEFQPTTALDMVKRLPGFAFEPGDTTVRGFAGALGNVLIDG